MLMDDGLGQMDAGVTDSIESFKFSNATSVIQGLGGGAGRVMHTTSSKSFLPVDGGSIEKTDRSRISNISTIRNRY